MKLLNNINGFKKHFLENVSDDVIEFLYRSSRITSNTLISKDVSEKRNLLKTKISKEKFRSFLGKLECNNLDPFRESVKGLVKPEKRPYLREHINEFVSEFGILPVVLHIISESTDAFIDEIVFSLVSANTDAYTMALRDLKIPSVYEANVSNAEEILSNKVSCNVDDDISIDNADFGMLTQAINIITEAIEYNDDSLLYIKSELDKLAIAIEKKIEQRNELRECIREITDIINAINGIVFDGVREYLSLEPVLLHDGQYLFSFEKEELRKMKEDLEHLYQQYSECRDILPVIQQKFDREKNLRMLELHSSISNIMAEVESLIAVAKTDTTIDVGFIENKFTETKESETDKVNEDSDVFDEGYVDVSEPSADVEPEFICDDILLATMDIVTDQVIEEITTSDNDNETIETVRHTDDHVPEEDTTALEYDNESRSGGTADNNSMPTDETSGLPEDNEKNELTLIDRDTDKKVLDPSDSKAEMYEKSIYECLFNMKLNSAYWLTKEAENRGICINSIPSWMIKLCIVALYAENYGSEERSYIDETYKHHSDPVSEITNLSGLPKELISLLVSVISIRPALLAPECGTVGWFGRYSESLGKNGEAYYEVFRNVLEFTNSGAQYCFIRENDAIGWEERAVAQSNRIVKFVDEIKTKRINFGPANIFIKSIFDPKHDIGKAYLIVAGNEYGKRKQVESVLEEYLFSYKGIQDLIVKTVSDIQSNVYHFNNARPIEGKALNLLTSRLQEFKDMCDVWLSIIDEDIECAEYNWNFEKSREFNKEIASAWIRSKQRLSSVDVKDTEGLSGEYVIRHLCRLYTDEIINSRFGAITTGLDIKAESQKDLMHYWKRNLIYPLLFVKHPEVIEDDNINVTIDLGSDCEFLKAYFDGFDLDRALDMHMDAYDFKLAYLCADMINDENNEITERISEREAEAKAEILQYAKEIEQKIIQASIDHIISESEHSKLEGQIMAIRKEVLPDSRHGARLYLCLKNLESIRVRLIELQEIRQNSLKRNFEKLDSQIDDEAETLGERSVEKLKEYLGLGRESLDKGQIGLADQYLDFVESCLKNGEISEYDPKGSKKDNYIKEFVTIVNDLYKLLEEEHNLLGHIYQVIQSQSQKVSNIPIARVLRNLQNVPGERLNEIKNGMEAWQRLKSAGIITGDRIFAEPIASIFKYMGFQVAPNDVQTIKIDPPGSTHCRLRMKDGGLSPLAEFGSARNNTYDVVFIYNRPNSQSIYQSLVNMNLHTGSPVVVFLGRLMVKQRDEWMEVCRQHKLTALLVDELLMYYLASVRENRLAATISCGVSLSSIMPYISFGMIPKELFKGRKGLINTLAKPEDSCIVYGGRQLGKSVLLHMVRQEYHRPDNGVYVFYEDIKTLGDVGGIHSKSDIWRIMLDKMISEGFLDSGCSGLHTTRDISAAIIKKLKEKPTYRVIMLLDEADNFIEADSKENFPEIVMMRKIMDETNRRFKVVLCGLHSVLKFSSVPNHPFAQMMANPIVVSPLDPEAAQELIIDPLTAIGFDFSTEESKNAVFKILSYTNYHPALIQQFCTEIIREVRREKKRLPISLSVANVESVYKKEGIKEFIKERFVWTLNLDTRYAVIVYSMVVEQLYDYDGYRREFTAKEIQQLAGYNWPEGFKDIPYDSLVSILDELVRLGVLVKLEANGTYRLRNANIVRSLGTEDEIIQRLDEIRGKASPVSDDLDIIRLNFGGGKSSIFSARQISDIINPSSSGLCMLFGSEALGINDFRDFVKYIESYDKSRICLDMSSKIKTKEVFNKEIIQVRHKHKTSCKQIIAYCNISKAKIHEGLLQNTLSWLLGYIKEYTDDFVNLRVVLIFDSNATYRWLVEKYGNKNSNTDLEEKTDTLVFLKKWDYKALHKYLTDMDIVCNEENARTAIEVTGGWPYFISELIQKTYNASASEPPDIRRIIADMETLIKNRLLADKRDFMRKCGILSSVKVENLLKFIRQFEPISIDDIIGLNDDKNEFGLKNISEHEKRMLLDYMSRLSLVREEADTIASDSCCEAVWEA